MKYKRSLIGPNLRPLVKGTNISFCDSVCMPENLKLDTIQMLIIAYDEDMTATHLFEYAQLQGYCVFFFKLNDLNILKLIELFNSSKFKNLHPKPGIFFRSAATSDPALSQIIYYVIDYLYFYPGKIVNRPSRHSLNESKPLQMVSILHQKRPVVSGIESYITKKINNTILDQANKFIIKSVSGKRSRVVKLNNKMLLDIEKNINCPLQIQKKLEGKNVRVHVCGNFIQAIEIVSKSLDYRIDNDAYGRFIKLPKEVHQWCIDITKAENLIFSGIDLFQGKDHRWYCFEVNPMPGYHFFENIVKDPSNNKISKLICDYLV